MTRNTLLAAVALLLLAIPAAATMTADDIQPEGEPRVIVMPFENLTGSPEAVALVRDSFVSALQAKGWMIADVARTDLMLEESRVRYFDSLDESVRTRMTTVLASRGVISGVIYKYTAGRNPVVGLAARMTRADGTLAWAEVGALTAQDTERMLGFGRDADLPVLTRRVVGQMLDSFPKPDRSRARVKGAPRTFFMRSAASYRSPSLDPERPHLICVLPFENYSTHPDAARIVADVLAVKFAQSKGFDVVDAAKLRAAAVKARIGTFRFVTSDDLTRLAPAVGTSYFVRGTIFDFEDPDGRQGGDPEIQVELSIVDVDQSRVVLSAQHARKGRDYEGLLLLGAVTNTVSLTDRVMGEIVEAGLRPAPAGQAAVTAKGGRRVPERHSELRSRKGENQ